MHLRMPKQNQLKKGKGMFVLLDIILSKTVPVGNTANENVMFSAGRNVRNLNRKFDFYFCGT